MTRRALLLVPLAARLQADSAGDVWDLVSSMAAALSEDNVSEFLAAFDRSMPGYRELESNSTAMLREAEARSSIEPVRNEGGDRRRTVELDWTLVLAGREHSSASERRERRVTSVAVKTGRKWRIVSFDPLDLFAPPRW